jgi:hypothetical protein
LKKFEIPLAQAGFFIAAILFEYKKLSKFQIYPAATLRQAQGDKHSKCVSIITVNHCYTFSNTHGYSYKA